MASKTIAQLEADNDYGNITTGDKVIVKRGSGDTGVADFRVELSEDASPQLGGDLDLNAHLIAGASATEIGYLINVTSAIQTQLDAKAPLASPTFTGTVALAALTFNGTTITATGDEINYLSGVTSNIQDQIDAFSGGLPAVPSAGKILRSDGADWVSSTLTVPDTIAARSMLVANSANTLSVLTLSGDYSFPYMNNGGNWNSIPTSLNWINFLSNPTSANLRAFLTDESGTGAALFQSGALGTPASGTLTNCTGLPASAGTSCTATNDSASAGQLGQIIESSIPSGSAVSATSGVTLDVTSISLTAGDWDVWANVLTAPAAGTTTTRLASAISTTSATFPTPPNGGAYNTLNGVSVPAGANVAQAVGMMRISAAGTTTVYLVANVTFASSTMGVYGYLGARRRR